MLASDERALYALNPEHGALRWTYRSPFDQSGTLLPCLSVEPLPSGLILGALNEGGAICYKRSSIHLISAQGALEIKLHCHDPRGCGERIAMTRVISSLDLGPPKEHSVLIMGHPVEEPLILS